MKLELRNHPACRRSKITGDYLRDENGERVPLFPEERSIWAEGPEGWVMIGYCHSQPGRPVALVRRVDPLEKQQILEFVAVQTGGRPKRISQPPDPAELEDLEGDEDE